MKKSLSLLTSIFVAYSLIISPIEASNSKINHHFSSSLPADTRDSETQIEDDSSASDSTDNPFPTEDDSSASDSTDNPFSTPEALEYTPLPDSPESDQYEAQVFDSMQQPASTGDNDNE